MSPFSTLYDYVLPYVPAVETPLVDYHIRRVVREFARRTTLWRRTITVETVVGQSSYLLQPYDSEACLPAEGPIASGWESFLTFTDAIAYTVTTFPGIEADGPSCLTLTSDSSLTAWVEGSAAEAFDLRISVSAYDGGPSPGSFEDLPARLVVEFAEGGESEYDLYFLQGTGGWFTLEGVSAYRVLPANFGVGGGLDYNETAALCIEVTTPGGGEIAPVPVCGAYCDPHKIISVCVGDKPIPSLPEGVRPPTPAWPRNDKPRQWFSPSARVLNLFPAPDDVYTITVEVVCVLSLTHGFNYMPQSFAVDYLDVLADGVVASLKQQTGKPWFDLQGASIAGGRFAMNMRTIRASLRDGDQPNASRFLGPRFGK